MKTTTKNQPAATYENTVFLTVAAYDDYESQTIALRKSAADHEIPLTLCDVGKPWQGFYHHKIEMMSEHLMKIRDERKRFAFILDSRDVVFIEHLDSIFKKFNALNDGRTIFNHDMPGAPWPSLKDYHCLAMEEAMGSEHVQLNAGMIAGDIETILKIHRHVMALRRELIEGRPRGGLLERLYQDIGTGHSDDDQYLYQVCMTYYPELFRIDYDKELFAVLMSYPKDLREHSDDPRRHDVINNAAIIHSPWLSRDRSRWTDRVLQNRWMR